MRSEPPPFQSSDLFVDAARFERAVRLIPNLGDLTREYRPWRKVQSIARDRGLNPEDAWAALKLLRRDNTELLELVQPNGNQFSWCSGPFMLEPLHRIDRATGGSGPYSLEGNRGILADDAHRHRIHIRSLMDEAIESSLIEGAAQTRKDAIDLLRSQRPPRGIGERMIVNNFVAMQQIKQWLDRPLSTEMLLDLQGILTEGTLKEPEQARRLRRSDENIRVFYEPDDRVIFTPPSAGLLPERLSKLCAFANATHEGDKFIHPIVKACILHFMIGYEHPFADGNGRTARAVFYWHALRHGYTLFEYVPISERIRHGVSKYPQAYVDCEEDGGDLTYFILYKLDIIEQSLTLATDHLKEEEARITRSERLLRLSKNLNLRQRLLLEHALRHPRTLYTVKSHAHSNGIRNVTARNDLQGLVRLRLMTTSKNGREVIYHPAPTLATRLAAKS